ncbi:hypothetical protein ACJRO7_019305 [Eucalyptus globulus]|uniref:Uncharacterized protein n=1 Tax=Eucalyptus globulus TaxID=34317 RepID=A0ABD3KHF3_EUCGL
MAGSESKDRERGGATMAAGVIAGLSSGRKNMKAPGRDARIFRDEFAKDPAGYFRDLRK